MKKILSILLISAILTGCGNISEDKLFVAEETTTVSQKADDTAETTASDATDTTTSAVTVTNEVTTSKSSQSVTDKTAENITAEAENADVQPKKENKQSQNSQENNTSEVKKPESKSTTVVQTTPQKVTTAPAVKENKTTTSIHTAPPVVTTSAPIVTQPPKQTEPPAPKQQVLDYDRLNDQMQTFIDGYDIDYDWLYDKGKALSHDGTDYGKAVAVCNEAENMGGVNCINYALNAYFMAQGAGLECYIARSSDHDWYGHVANIIKLDGKWYYMEPMDNIVGSPYSYAGGGVDYPNGLDIVTDIYDHPQNVSIESDWYK